MHAQESNKIFRPFFMCEGSVYADEEALLLCPIGQSILIVYTVVACCINWEKIKRTMHLA
jgi:hypothetical protein